MQQLSKGEPPVPAAVFLPDWERHIYVPEQDAKSVASHTETALVQELGEAAPGPINAKHSLDLHFDPDRINEPEDPALESGTPNPTIPLNAAKTQKPPTSSEFFSGLTNRCLEMENRDEENELNDFYKYYSEILYPPNRE